ncbi:MAG: hypothetical protein J0L93_01920 [Deltaproteobacteria bacterium]|nr:hypothetical protein [Deltaproteobacteria bacterium]
MQDLGQNWGVNGIGIAYLVGMGGRNIIWIFIFSFLYVLSFSQRISAKDIRSTCVNILENIRADAKTLGLSENFVDAWVVPNQKMVTDPLQYFKSVDRYDFVWAPKAVEYLRWYAEKQWKYYSFVSRFGATQRIKENAKIRLAIIQEVASVLPSKSHPNMTYIQLMHGLNILMLAGHVDHPHYRDVNNSRYLLNWSLNSFRLSQEFAWDWGQNSTGENRVKLETPLYRYWPETESLSIPELNLRRVLPQYSLGLIKQWGVRADREWMGRKLFFFHDLGHSDSSLGLDRDSIGVPTQIDRDHGLNWSDLNKFYSAIHQRILNEQTRQQRLEQIENPDLRFTVEAVHFWQAHENGVFLDSSRSYNIPFTPQAMHKQIVSDRSSIESEITKRLKPSDFGSRRFRPYVNPAIQIQLEYLESILP